jgi:hypothetical protein
VARPGNEASHKQLMDANLSEWSRACTERAPEERLGSAAQRPLSPRGGRRYGSSSSRLLHRGSHFPPRDRKRSGTCLCAHSSEHGLVGVQLASVARRGVQKSRSRGCSAPPGIIRVYANPLDPRHSRTGEGALQCVAARGTAIGGRDRRSACLPSAEPASIDQLGVELVINPVMSTFLPAAPPQPSLLANLPLPPSSF